MNRWWTSLGFVVLTLCVSPLSMAEQVVPSPRVRSHVVIRELNNSRSREVGRLRRGESLALVRSVPRWHEVRLAAGGTGFVSKSWTRVVGDGLAPRQPDELRVHFLNVGAGTCTIVECPGTNNPPPMIVDCGSLAGTADDVTPAQATEYFGGVLDSHSVGPNLVLSHADRDHYGWIPTVLAGRQMQNIWQGSDPAGYTEDEFPTWLAGQVANGAVVHAGPTELPPDFHNGEAAIGDALGCGDASVFVLTANSGSSKNAASLVIEIRYQDFGVTLTGDAEGRTERRARENFGGNVKTTVLSGSHHGARTHSSNSATWVAATAPEMVVFSAGRRFGHPQCDAVNRYTNALANVPAHPTQCGISSDYETVRTSTRAIYMTELSGRIVITSNGRSPFSLSCTRNEGCEAQIAH